ncbi:hypothetical protein [Leucobacter ruminantium]|uniref:Scaffolding protein n=1 Tax=Leucobacter ruminantium TaxID=1289170 RepID=A0A939LW94_9MICO|nr:hypothetical protein [Leucobacter ruminantium]MBO1805964.1 hypothetical protein [Leucobacter ruminantium]
MSAAVENTTNAPEGMTIDEAKEQIQDRYEEAQQATPAGTEQADDHIPEDQGHDQENAESESTPTRASSEAAKYRRQLRATETERDQLRNELDQARRMLLARDLDKHTISSADGTLKLHPAALADVTLPSAAFTGLTIDTNAVKAFFEELYEAKPYMFHKAGEELRSMQPRAKLRGGSNPYDEPEVGPKFTNAFKPRK